MPVWTAAKSVAYGFSAPQKPLGWFAQETSTDAERTVVQLPEMVTAAREFGGRNFSYIEAMTVAGLLFLLASYPTAVLMQKLEKKLAY